MKRIFVIVLAALLLLSLAACGASASTSDEPADASKVVIGNWNLTVTTPDGVKSQQTLTFNEDGTGAYALIENGEQTNAYDFTWTYEDSEFVCVSEKYNERYIYNGEKDTLTDKSSQGRVFKPAN